jgi:hypothetical protein
MANPAFLTANAFSEYLRSDGIPVEAHRLVELADARLIPHARLEDGSLMFRKVEAKRWVMDNLVRECPGRSLSVPFSVFDPVSWRGQVAGVPRELEPIADCLREFPVGITRSVACVYFLVRKGMVVYVGMSDLLFSRILVHRRDKVFDRVLFLSVQPEAMSTVEAAFIRVFKPEYNAPSTHNFLTDDIAHRAIEQFRGIPEETDGTDRQTIIERQSRRIAALTNSYEVAEAANVEMKYRFDEIKSLFIKLMDRWSVRDDCEGTGQEDHLLLNRIDAQLRRR